MAVNPMEFVQADGLSRLYGLWYALPWELTWGGEKGMGYKGVWAIKAMDYKGVECSGKRQKGNETVSCFQSKARADC